MTLKQLPPGPEFDFVLATLSRQDTALDLESDTSTENPDSEETSVPVRLDALGRRLGREDTLLCDLEGWVEL